MGASTQYLIYGYELVEKEIWVSAITSQQAIEVATAKGLINPYVDRQYPELTDEGVSEDG